MNIRQLQFFCQAARTGTFSAAARNEGVSTQAISKSIHDLENEFGEALFIRAGKGMRITPFGEAVLDSAREAVNGFEAVERTVATWQQSQGPRQDLRVALITPPFAKHELICGIVGRLMSHAIGVPTKISVSLGPSALADLKAGTIDAMFTIGELQTPRCTCTKIGTVLPGVFLGRNHPLGRKRALTFKDLEPYPVLYSEDIDRFNDTILVTCRNCGLASPLRKIDTDEGVMDHLENQNGYILGVNLKALSIKPFAMMHDLDPNDAPAIPICLVLCDEPRRYEVERLDQFVRNEFSLMKKLFNAEGSVDGY